MIVEGSVLIDLEGRTIELAPRQGFVVPERVVHRTRAPERAVILMVDGAAIVPTVDSGAKSCASAAARRVMRPRPSEWKADA